MLHEQSIVSGQHRFQTCRFWWGILDSWICENFWLIPSLAIQTSCLITPKLLLMVQCVLVKEKHHAGRKCMVAITDDQQLDWQNVKIFLADYHNLPACFTLYSIIFKSVAAPLSIKEEDIDSHWKFKPLKVVGLKLAQVWPISPALKLSTPVLSRSNSNTDKIDKIWSKQEVNSLI